MNTAAPLLLVKSGGPQALPEWQQHFQAFAPELEVRGWDDPAVDPARVEYALVWQPEPGRLARYPQLRAILSTAAGVDHILADSALPPGIPVVRMVTGETAQRMAEFTAMACLMAQKDMPRAIAQQRACQWEEFSPPRSAAETRVGVMGLGALGMASAQTLLHLGFEVAGWAR